MTTARPPYSNRSLSLLAAPAIVAVDLCAKAWARYALVQDAPVEITPFFNLALSFNRGVAFGLMNGAGVAFVAGVTVVITFVFGVWWWREANPIARFGLAMILGGAIANLIDRVMRGAVTDFLDLHIAGLHWPTFNLADAALSVGVIVLLVASAQKPSQPMEEDAHEV